MKNRRMNQPPIINNSQVVFRSNEQLDVVQRQTSPFDNLEGLKKIGPLLLLGLIFWGALVAFQKVDFSASQASSGFNITDVDLSSTSGKGVANWLVVGTVVNRSNKASPAPRLTIQLKRPDKSVASEGVLDLSGQMLPPHASLRFQYRLSSPPGEALKAVILPEER